MMDLVNSVMKVSGVKYVNIRVTWSVVKIPSVKNILAVVEIARVITGVTSVTIRVKSKTVKTLLVSNQQEERVMNAKTTNGARFVRTIVQRTVLECAKQAMANVIRVLMERGVSLAMKRVSVIIVNIAISRQGDARNAESAIGTQTVIVNARMIAWLVAHGHQASVSQITMPQERIPLKSWLSRVS